VIDYLEGLSLYLRQVNEVNWQRYCFHRIVSVCLCVRSEPVNLTVSALFANSSKAVKDFKFDAHASRDSPGMILENFRKGAWPGSGNPQNFWTLKCL